MRPLLTWTLAALLAQAPIGPSSARDDGLTAFVEEIRSGFVTVRLNFVESKHLSSNEGQTTDRDTPILDPKAYQVAFDKIGDAIFVRSATR